LMQQRPNVPGKPEGLRRENQDGFCRDEMGLSKHGGFTSNLRWNRNMMIDDILMIF